MEWRKLGDRDFGLVPIRSLVQGRPNYRRMTPEQFAALKASMRANGFATAILVAREEDGTFRVIDGHHRWQAAEELGMQSIPAVLLDKGEEPSEQLLAMLTFNISAEVQGEEYLSILQELRGTFSVEALAEATALPANFLDDLATAAISEETRGASEEKPPVDRSRGVITSIPLPSSDEVQSLVAAARGRACAAGLPDTDTQAVLWALRTALDKQPALAESEANRKASE